MHYDKNNNVKSINSYIIILYTANQQTVVVDFFIIMSTLDASPFDLFDQIEPRYVANSSIKLRDLQTGCYFVWLLTIVGLST